MRRSPTRVVEQVLSHLLLGVLSSSVPVCKTKHILPASLHHSYHHDWLNVVHNLMRQLHDTTIHFGIMLEDQGVPNTAPVGRETMNDIIAVSCKKG